MAKNMEENLNNQTENKLKKVDGKFKKMLFFIKRNCKKILFVLITIIAIIACISITKSYFTTNSGVVNFGFKDVGELVTQTSYQTIVKDIDDPRKLFNITIPFSKSRQIFSYDVEVDASIDFSKIEWLEKKEENFAKNEKGIIIVKVPHARIYKKSIIESSLKVYLDEESLFSNINLEEEHQARMEIEEEAVQRALSNGILERADESAKNLIEMAIKSNEKYKNYEIVIEYI